MPPKNTVILIKRLLKGICKRNHSEARLPKSTRFFSPGTKKTSDFRNLHCVGQLKNRTICVVRCRSKASSTASRKSLDRNSSTEWGQKYRSSLCPFTKVSTIKRSARKNIEKSLESVKHAKSPKFHETNETGTLAEKQPRSYAQMIASYSQKMYAQSGLRFLKDAASFTSINEIHRSPFSTASTVSLKWKTKNKAAKESRLQTTGVVQQNANFSSGVSMTRYDCRNEHRTIFPNFEENNDPENISSSYASMIEKYSNAMSSGVSVYGSKNSMIPKRNVSTKLDVVPMTFLNAKNADNKSTPVATNNAETASKNITAAERNDVEEEGQIGWITRVEDIIKDLKKITAKKEATDIPPTDRWVLQSVNERAHWLDRVVTAHKKMIEDRKSMSSKTLGHGKANESNRLKESTLKTFSSKEFNLQESNLKGSTFKESNLKQSTLKESTPKDSKLKKDTVLPQSKAEQKPTPNPQMTTSSNKPSNPISQYINRGPPNPSTPTKNTSQTPTNVSTSPVKEPQIELRMTPSQNESIVSINVDELAAKTAGTKDQLSVVISSNRNKAGTMDANNLNPRSDFGSMQISISENTVPVKQIEFSINGKPVSELKSIVARADKLDVVSSMDKVEIRIPSSKGKVSEHAATLTKTATSSTPVLNLQIAAKFNEPHVQQPKDTGLKPETSTTPNPLPPTPPKPRTVFTPKPSKSEASSPSVTGVKKPENISGTKQKDTFSAFDARGTVVKQETSPFADTDPAIVKTNTAILHQVNSNRNTPATDPVPQPSMNIETPSANQPRQDRTPSNSIPWWSSEDSFKKIKKKNNTPKSAKAAEDEVPPEQDQESDSVAQKTGQELSPGVVYEQQYSSVDSSKTVPPGKDVAAKKPVLDEKQMSDLPDSAFRVVRVRSPPRRMVAKPATSVKTLKNMKKSNSVSSVRVAKKIKYRPQSNVVKSTVVKKKDEPPVSVPHPPKVFRYVSVNPQRASMAKKPEAAKATSVNAKVEEQQTTASTIEPAKVEQEAKGDTKVEKFATPQGSNPQVGKANVQHSKTIFKQTNLEKPANRSAGVSAKSSLELAKGREQDKTDRTVEKNSPRRSETADDSEDQRLKKILKSMKPIEKRKDGTLIDYGVTVPSRKPKGKFRQIPVIRSKTPIGIDANKVVTVSTTKLKDAPAQEKIVEPQKVSSAKKQTITEPKSVSAQAKIVEAEKILSVKKETLTEPKAVSTREKIVEAEKVLSVKKEVVTEPKKVPTQEKVVEAEKVSSVKKETLTEHKDVPLVKIVDADTIYSTKKAIETKSSETKKLKELGLAIQRQIQNNSDKKEPQKVQTINLQKRVGSTSKLAELKKNNTDVSKRATSAAVPLEKTTPKPSPEISPKRSNANVTNTSKSSILDKVKSSPLEGTITSPRFQFSGKQGLQRYPKLPEKPGKAPFEGTIVHSARVVDRKVPSVDAPPLVGTITFPSQELSLKTMKNSNRLSKQTSDRLEKKLSNSKISPPKNTIDHHSRKQDSLRSFTEVNKKKVSSEVIQEKDAAVVVNTKPPSNKGGGSTESNGPPGILTGPAGLISPRSTTMAQVSSNAGTSMSVKCLNQESYGKTNEEGYVLFSNDAVGSEKNILYSSWLQRVNGKFDKDNVV